MLCNQYYLHTIWVLVANSNEIYEASLTTNMGNVYIASAASLAILMDISSQPEVIYRLLQNFHFPLV